MAVDGSSPPSSVQNRGLSTTVGERDAARVAVTSPQTQLTGCKQLVDHSIARGSAGVSLGRARRIPGGRPRPAALIAVAMKFNRNVAEAAAHRTKLLP